MSCKTKHGMDSALLGRARVTFLRMTGCKQSCKTLPCSPNVAIKAPFFSVSKAAKEMMDWSFKSRALPDAADNIKPKVSLPDLGLARISSMRVCRGQMQSFGASFYKSYFYVHRVQML